MARSTQLQARKFGAKKPTRISVLDSPPVKVVALSKATVSNLVSVAGVSRATAKKVLAGRKSGVVRSPATLRAIGLRRADLEKLQRCILFADDRRIVIEDVQPIAGYILSERPFALRVKFTAGPAANPVLVSAIVQWAGRPFIVEKRISSREAGAGSIDLKFGHAQTLPTGTAAFHVSIFGERGSQARFRVSCAVLPSNPFSLALSPNVNFVTGTFSARAVRSGGNFVTDVQIRWSNGDGASATIPGAFQWRFWDGGVGGSLVEHGTGDFGGSITVAAHSIRDGFITFTSPPGSGVFNKLDGREDMTLEIEMGRPGGGTVTGTITVRTMFLFGLNITRVSWEAFTGSEEMDLDNAALVTRQIYERRDLSIDLDARGIPQARVGGFEVITSEDEARDLFDAWSGPDTNNNIDVFVVQSISGTGFDGLAGGIPGPTSHHGRDSGVVVDKHGFVDMGGTKHLDIDYHGMVMAHEVGHYLGLSHIDEAHNLMLWNSDRNDTNLNYDPQYRTIIRHGWVNIS
jgi:hypothetical protein